jgi:2-polyprenyl-3-methyl-5-hydroxy-6-metoxy-1,4-benzoquinol methylase
MKSSSTVSFEVDVERGKRFEFGKNWTRFLSVLDEERIDEACKSLTTMLGVSSLAGRSFADVGSGSGLFSLAAMRLGAARVHSFDFDPKSVACGRALKSRFFPDATTWTIQQGSALDAEYLAPLGEFDIVYSWGVLHHTGAMWTAIENVTRLVRGRGLLFIAIYNDQGWLTACWRWVKRTYNRSWIGRWLILAVFCSFFAVEGALADGVRLRNPIKRYAAYKRSRGMSRVHDWVDWLGGLPFEVATPDQIIRFCKERGFQVENLLLRSPGHGCNEFVFSKTRAVAELPA